MIIILQAMNNTYYYHHLPYIVKHNYSKYANQYLNLYNRHCQLRALAKTVVMIRTREAILFIKLF